MKKFLAATIFVAVLIFGGIQPAFAQDVYIETYDGRDIYVVTESIDTNGVDYVNVTLKFIQNGRLTRTEHRQLTSTAKVTGGSVAKRLNATSFAR